MGERVQVVWYLGGLGLPVEGINLNPRNPRNWLNRAWTLQETTTEMIVASARARGEPTFLPIDVSEAIASRHPLYQSEEIPGSAFT